jgi:hypothetical protein
MEQKTEKSQVPHSYAVALGFLTIGIGVLRSVGAVELALRAVVVVVVSSVCIRLLMFVWNSFQPQQ